MLVTIARFDLYCILSYKRCRRAVSTKWTLILFAITLLFATKYAVYSIFRKVSSYSSCIALSSVKFGESTVLAVLFTAVLRNWIPLSYVILPDIAGRFTSTCTKFILRTVEGSSLDLVLSPTLLGQILGSEDDLQSSVMWISTKFPADIICKCQ